MCWNINRYCAGCRLNRKHPVLSVMRASTKVESMLCNITVAPSMGCASASVTFPLIVCAVAVPAKEIRNNNVPIIICFSYSLVFNIFFNFDETKVGRLFSLPG